MPRPVAAVLTRLCGHVAVCTTSDSIAISQLPDIRTLPLQTRQIVLAPRSSLLAVNLVSLGN
jgi:hypothetical protein